MCRMRATGLTVPYGLRPLSHLARGAMAPSLCCGSRFVLWLPVCVGTPTLCWDSQFVLYVGIQGQGFVQLFLQAARALLLLLICERANAPQSGSPRTFISVSSLPPHEKRFSCQKQLCSQPQLFGL